MTVPDPVGGEAGGEAAEAVMPQSMGEAVPGTPIHLMTVIMMMIVIIIMMMITPEHSSVAGS